MSADPEIQRLPSNTVVGADLERDQAGPAETATIIDLVPHIESRLSESELTKELELDEDAVRHSARIQKYLSEITAPTLMDLTPGQPDAVDEAQKAGLSISNLTHVK